MSAGWVAGTVRARAISRRRLGRVAARRLAARGSLTSALEDLVASPYRHDVRLESTLAQAQHAVTETLLWNARVLAGWLPRSGVNTLRLLAGWFELLGVESQLRALEGTPGEERPYQLGSLATLGTRAMSAASTAELRDVLATSPWGDPGGMTARELHLWLRLRLAARVRSESEVLDRWASGAAALLVARERFVRHQVLPAAASAAAQSLLGFAASNARTVADFRAAIPAAAAWAVADVEAPIDLWRAESGWWLAVEHDGRKLLGKPRPGPEPVLGALALLATDAWRVRAALEIAVRGGGPLEVFDAVA